MKYIFFYHTDIGKIGIAENGTAITNLYFGGQAVSKEFVLKETELLKHAAQQLLGYLDGQRKEFNLPLSAEGTEFQKTVWNALQEVPFGETRSYGEIAKTISNPKACRAVGMANNKNPIPIFIPCHRIIGSNGKLVGYAGGLDLKSRLLNIENRNSIR